MSVLRVVGSSLGIFVLACSGCIRSTVRLYEGRPLAAGQVSRVYNTSRAFVRSMNGRPVLHSGDTSTTMFELRPGRHTIVVGPPTRTDPTHEINRELQFDFRPGRSYSFVVAEVHGPGDDKYVVRLVDCEAADLTKPHDAPAAWPGSGL